MIPSTFTFMNGKPFNSELFRLFFFVCFSFVFHIESITKNLSFYNRGK